MVFRADVEIVQEYDLWLKYPGVVSNIQRRVAQMMYALFLMIFLSGCFTCTKTQEDVPKRAGSVETDAFTTDVERFAEEAMGMLGVLPGLGLAIVRNDEVMYLGGFGLRDVEKQLPVTIDTGFYIASVSKQFTGMTTSILAHEELLDLHSPITQYLSDLTPPSWMNTASITPHSLLTHTSGVESTINMLSWSGQSRAQLVQLLETSTRRGSSDFRYSNLGYVVMGHILETIADKPWQQLETEMLFQKLDMTGTTSLLEEARSRDYAYPYIGLDGKFSRLNEKEESMMHPAGGHISTPTDLASWLLTIMNEGSLNGKQVLPPQAVQNALAPHTRLEASLYKFDRFAYGYGWYHSKYEEDLLLHHFGGFDGYQAHVSFMPEHKIGVAVVGNATDNGAGILVHLVATYVYDRMLEKPEIEEQYLKEIQALADRIEQEKNRTSSSNR